MTENELYLKDKVKLYLDLAVQLNQFNAATEKNESEPRSRCKLFALTLKSFKNEFEQLHDLLEELSMFYNQSTDIDSALQTLPETGQLLGRLCGIPMLTSNPGCYLALMKCIFSIYKCQPVTSLEMAAKAWALSQLRSSLMSKEEDLTLRKFGIDVTEIQQLCLSQVVEELTTMLKNNSRQCDIQGLNLLATLFTCYPFSPELSPLLETVLELLSQYPLNGDILNLYQSLTASQRNGYSSKELSSTLSYKSLLHLWKSYLPSLEQEILRLITAATTVDGSLPPEIRVVVNSRQLPRACAESNQIFHTVYKIFPSLIFQAPNCRMLSDVYNVFSELVYDFRRKCNSKGLFNLDICYHPCTRTLFNLLHTPISDLSTFSSECQMSCIACEMHKLSDEDRVEGEVAEIWLCLQQYKSWYYKAILLCLIGDVRIQDSCITVILFYQDCKIQPNRQCSLTEVVNSLRLLLSKCNLRQRDLQYATSANQHPEDGVLRTVIGQLLVVMLLHSVAGVKLAKEILSMVCPGSSVKEMVNSLVQMPISLHPDMKKWSVYKMKEFKDTLLQLVQLSPECEEKPQLMKIVQKYLNQF